jgi:hypothetical protein
MPKKTYMDSRRIISEGFFDKIKSFLKGKSKLTKDQRKDLLKKGGLSQNIKKLNKSVDTLENTLRKNLPDDYPPIPRFTLSDFI